MSYVPALVSERYTDAHEQGWDACVYCSIAMLADAASGAPVTTPQALEAIDDPHHTKTGTTISGGLGALAQAAPAARRKISYLANQNDTIDGLLAAGNGLALTGLYSALPSHFTRWDPPFAAKGAASGHAMYIQRDGPSGAKAGNVWLLDPLATPGYAGEWLPTEALHAFIATRIQHAYAPIAGRTDMGLIVITHRIDTTYEVTAAKGVDLYSDVACTDRVTETSKAGTLNLVGLPWPGAPALAVVFATGSPFPDRQTRAVIGWVKRSAVSAPRIKPVPPPPKPVTADGAVVTLSDGRTVAMHP